MQMTPIYDNDILFTSLAICFTLHVEISTIEALAKMRGINVIIIIIIIIPPINVAQPQCAHVESNGHALLKYWSRGSHF